MYVTVSAASLCRRLFEHTCAQYIFYVWCVFKHCEQWEAWEIRSYLFFCYFYWKVAEVDPKLKLKIQIKYICCNLVPTHQVLHGNKKVRINFWWIQLFTSTLLCPTLFFMGHNFLGIDSGGLQLLQEHHIDILLDSDWPQERLSEALVMPDRSRATSPQKKRTFFFYLKMLPVGLVFDTSLCEMPWLTGTSPYCNQVGGWDSCSAANLQLYRLRMQKMPALVCDTFPRKGKSATKTCLIKWAVVIDQPSVSGSQSHSAVHN